MKEERLRILDLLAAGTISSEDAARLLEALGQSAGSEARTRTDSESRQTAGKIKWFCVVVHKQDERKVNVRIPVLLLRAGMKLKAMLPADVQAKVNMQLDEAGYGFRIDELEKANFDELLSALRDNPLIVESDDGERVRIFCE